MNNKNRKTLKMYFPTLLKIALLLLSTGGSATFITLSINYNDKIEYFSNATAFPAQLIVSVTDDNINITKTNGSFKSTMLVDTTKTTKSVITEEPSTTFKLNTTEEPSTTFKLNTTEEPSTTFKLNTTEEPSTTFKLNTTEEPSTTFKLNTTEEPSTNVNKLTTTTEFVYPTTTEELAENKDFILLGGSSIWRSFNNAKEIRQLDTSNIGISVGSIAFNGTRSLSNIGYVRSTRKMYLLESYDNWITFNYIEVTGDFTARNFEIVVYSKFYNKWYMANQGDFIESSDGYYWTKKNDNIPCCTFDILVDDEQGLFAIASTAGLLLSNDFIDYVKVYDVADRLSFVDKLGSVFITASQASRRLWVSNNLTSWNEITDVVSSIRSCDIDRSSNIVCLGFDDYYDNYVRIRLRTITNRWYVKYLGKDWITVRLSSDYSVFFSSTTNMNLIDSRLNFPNIDNNNIRGVEVLP